MTDFTDPPAVVAAPDMAVAGSKSAFAAMCDTFVAWMRSFGTWAATFITELETFETGINTQATNAAASAAAAATAETNAETAETNAETAATAAAASAATAVAAPGTSATSTTSLTIGTGAKSLTIQTGKSLVVGMTVKIARTSEPTKWMAGDVTAYNSGTGALDVTVARINNSGGPYTDWTVSLSGPITAGTSWSDLTGDAPYGLVLLSVASASSVAVVDFTGIDGTYDEYELHVQTAIPATNAVQARLSVSVDAGASFLATAYTYHYQRSNGATATSVGSVAAPSIIMSPATISNDAGMGGWSGVIRILAPADTTRYKQVIFGGGFATSATDGDQISGWGAQRTASAVNAIRFLFSSGNVASGKFKLYGVRKA